MANDSELARRLEAKRAAVMQSGDADALEQMFDDELVYTHSFGNRDSKSDYMAKFRDGFFNYHELRCETDSVVRRGDVLIVTGSMWARATVGGEERIIDNMATMVWAQQAGEWKFLSFAPTPVRR